MSLGVGGIVSVGGGTGGSSGGSESGIQTIQPGDNVGPTVEFQGVNGIEVTSPSTNVLLIDGAGASGVSGSGGGIAQSGLQEAYDVGREINVISSTGALSSDFPFTQYWDDRGVLIKSANGFERGNSFQGEGYSLEKVVNDYCLAVSGQHGTDDMNDVHLYAMTTMNPGYITFKSSGVIQSPSLALTPSQTLHIGFPESRSTPNSASISTSGSLSVFARNGIIDQTYAGYLASARSASWATSDTILGNGQSFFIASAENLQLSAGTIARGGGQISLRPFGASGQLVYRLGGIGGHEAWHWSPSYDATGGPNGDGFHPIPHSGQICHMILEKVNSDAKFAQDFTNITSGIFSHNKGTRDVLVQVHDDSGPPRILIPDAIIFDNLDQVSLLFNHPQSGRVVII